ncbi:B- and T-lymphocyte attenuator isoform X2 [Hemiscyllium ocellatum]|uniref:B- and T-lymphocyte attenuator isoform X2 n=1 Tax=Hemiscyllium ocellatum TaxID=170820 RepID=UPI0029671D2F|nr:B- and T-lymphocyte attenuator isoform X2 [Hemiscyllium ocellatum]
MTTQWRMTRCTRTQMFLVLAAFLYVAVYPEENHSCPVRVGYPRAMFNCSTGDRLTLNCTVVYCKGIELTVHWCKIHSNSCQSVNKITQHQLTDTNATEQQMLVVYTISSINLTDNGTYRCEAQQNAITAKGHSINLNVFVTATNSTMKGHNPLGTPIWIFYSIIVMGILGTVLFLVLFTYFCIKNFHESQETKEPTDKCERSECHAMTEANGKSTIYENTNECSEGIGPAFPNSLTVDNCNSPENHRNDAGCSNTDSDCTIIYASLNTSMLCRKSSITASNEEDTEYAAINIKN